jgi:hypothetical protein
MLKVQLDAERLVLGPYDGEGARDAIGARRRVDTQQTIELSVFEVTVQCSRQER